MFYGFVYINILVHDLSLIERTTRVVVESQNKENLQGYQSARQGHILCYLSMRQS